MLEMRRSMPEKIFGKINILIHKHARIINASRCTGCKSA